MKINGKEVNNDRLAISSDIHKAYEAVYALKYEYLDEDNVNTDRIGRAISALNNILKKAEEEYYG